MLKSWLPPGADARGRDLRRPAESPDRQRRRTPPRHYWSLVGEPRKGRDDTTYRRFIRARIRINRSEGTAKDIFDVLGLITSSPWHLQRVPARGDVPRDAGDPRPGPGLALQPALRYEGRRRQAVTRGADVGDERSVSASQLRTPPMLRAAAAVTRTSQPSYGLLSDAVTVRDPAAAPALPRPVAPVVLCHRSRMSARTQAVRPSRSMAEASRRRRRYLRSCGFTSLGADASNVDDVVVVSDALITCTTRARDESQPRKLAAWVKTPYGTSSRTAAFRYVAPPVLAILSVAPSSGVLGTVVVIRGSKLTDALEVGVEVYGDYTPMSSLPWTPTDVIVHRGLRHADHGCYADGSVSLCAVWRAGSPRRRTIPLSRRWRISASVPVPASADLRCR